MSNKNMTELTATELIELVTNMHITNDEENTEMVVINYNELTRIVSMYEDRLKDKDNKIKNLSELQARGGFRVAELSIENEYLQNESGKQKNEIELLKEEKKTLVWLNQDLENQVDKWKEQSCKNVIESDYWINMHNVLAGSYNKLKDENAELQKQVDELGVKVKSFEMTDLCKGAYIEQLKEENKELVSAKVFELETKNTKLQKQVDELTEEILRLNKDIIEISTNYMREKIKSRQAVKDTAKEIYNELKNEVISVDIPRGGEPSEEDCEAVLWWKIEKIFKKRGVEAE